MHLADLSVEGFKSFSESTDMNFNPGIGVIMGNNGVGKSNILDAIVWAMGEKQLATLRCLEPEELFFVGSKEYPPAETVRVELVFREGEDKDAPSFSVVRQIKTDGTETILLDGANATPDEFTAELARRGMADSLRTVIKQEQINDLMLMDPWQRLAWVQEMLSINGSESPSVMQDTVGPLFEEYLNYLIPQGKGRLRMLEQDGRAGLDVEVTLSGNRKRRAHQLSGGEKAISSLALKLALFEQLDSPFYMLDEVEPALDWTNHKSMQALLRALSAKKQLIMITHLRSTIELADTMHGVRTRRDGSSFMKFYFVMDSRLLRLYKCC